MRRADRLFQLVQLIRGRRLSTADFLSERLEVSPRTVYRDVAALQAQGVPIEGEAGVGYRMKSGFDLAPLMFGKREAQALVAALRMAQPSLDSGLAQAAESALSKIMAVLPGEARAAAESLTLFAPLSGLTPEVREKLAALREATESRRKLALEYVSLDDERSQRTVRPLPAFSGARYGRWPRGASCAGTSAPSAWTASRPCRALEDTFRDEPGKTLADMNRRQQEEWST